MSVRIYQLSKDLGISNKDLIELLRKRGFDVASASSSVADIYAEDLLKEYHREPQPQEPDPSRKGEPASEETPQNTVDGADKERATIHKTGDEHVAKVSLKLEVEEPAASGRSLRFEVVKPAENPAAQSSTTKAEPAASLGDDRPAAQGRRFLFKSAPERSSAMADGVLRTPPGSMLRSDEAPARPQLRMIPLDRLQSSVRAQHQRFNQARPGFTADRTRGRRDQYFNAPVQRKTEDVPRSFSSESARRAPSIRPIIPEKRPNLTPKVSLEAIGGEKILKLKLPVSVRDFAAMINIKPFQLISELMRMNVFASMNYLIDEPLARKIADQLGFQIELAVAVKRPEVVKKVVTDRQKETQIEARDPIVCVLGHVDHGKTTLLDTLRRSNVVAGEAGGITQHIGAYRIEKNGHGITFIDTPGHAAFSRMRERGVDVTDIAILVVAADDGFMPQTDEALKFAQRAGVPVIVAINKIDAKGANVDRVKQQMQQRNITSEDWGGETLCCPISALNGEGLDGLLEAVLLQAEMLELQADIKAPARGVVLESQIEVGRGPTASVILLEGVLSPGMALVSGDAHCKVKMLSDDLGKTVPSAVPSRPVKVIGWSNVLESGAEFTAVGDEKEARKMAAENGLQRSEPVAPSTDPSKRGRDKDGLDRLFAAINAQQKKVLQLVVKCDVQGTIEALIGCLEALPQTKVGLKIVSAAVGPVLKSDVEFAQNIGAVIVGFNVKTEVGVQALLKCHGVQLVQHRVIYELVDCVRDVMADLLDPEFHEEKLGAAQIRQVFSLTKVVIAGCMVTDGRVVRDERARIRRDGKVIFEGKIASLKRAKEDASEVRAGFECGIGLGNFSGYEIGDVIECYKIQKIRPNL